MFVPEQNDLVNANNTFYLPICLVAFMGLLDKNLFQQVWFIQRRMPHISHFKLIGVRPSLQ